MGAAAVRRRSASLIVTAGRADHDPRVLRAVPPEVTILTWVLPGLGHGLHVLGGDAGRAARARPAEQGRASSALQLSDILGTALGPGIAGAHHRSGHAGTGGDGLGLALAAVFAVSLVAAPSAACSAAAGRRSRPLGPCRSTPAAAVD